MWFLLFFLGCVFVQVASAPQQVLSPKRLRPANPLALTSPVAPPSVVQTLPPVISSHLLNNNYLLASQSQAAVAVANFTHPLNHPLAPFHHQPSPILQNLPHPLAAKSPALTQIQSIISSSPTATIPTQIPSYIATAQHQQIKSINTSTSFNSPPATSISQATNSTLQSPTSDTNDLATISPTATPNLNMDQVGQIGQPMQSHPLSQSMDSVNTASNEEEVSDRFI